jgi:NTE family protein
MTLAACKAASRAATLGCMQTWARRLCAAIAAATSAAVLAGCANIANAPINQPETAASRAQAALPRDIVGPRVIGLSLSGGGLRAAAFAHGVLLALAEGEGGQPPLWPELTFISAVSGGSLAAAHAVLAGPEGMPRFRQEVLLRDFERDLRLNLLSPVNLARLLAGGLNDRDNLGRVLDDEVFKGATFADLLRVNKPDLWINATDLFNRTPFPFIPQVFQGLCSDLSQLRVSEAVAASMAVPLAFAPVVLRTHPGHCHSAPPPWLAEADADPAGVAAGLVASTARAVRNYRDPTRMRYVKLADGGLTDNQGLASILVARAVSGNAYGPLTASDALRIRRMLFLVVDAGRPPSGNWALQPGGPSGVDVGIAAADAAIDSATRLSIATFRTMLQEWRDSIVRFRCAQPAAVQAQRLAEEPAWRCDDVVFRLGVIGFQSLPPADAERLQTMPTRLVLPASDIDFAIAAGRRATRAHPALLTHQADR